MTNRDKIIKITTNIAIVATVLLIYWIFIFVSITAFNFKVFHKIMTESFYLSLLGIFAILGGALILNVIMNLSKIADSLSQNSMSDRELPHNQSRRYIIGLLVSFPVIFLLLYAGDRLSASMKSQYLIASAKSIAEHNAREIQEMANYTFDKAYINKTVGYLTRMSKEEKDFPSVSLIVNDDVDGKRTLLAFNRYAMGPKENLPEKHQFIFSCSTSVRSYLNSVLEGKNNEPWFSDNAGFYELYFPVKTGKRTIVLYFTERSRYGKIGS